MACASSFKLQAAPLMAGVATAVSLLTEEVELHTSGSLSAGTFTVTDPGGTDHGATYGGVALSDERMLTAVGEHVLGFNRFSVFPFSLDIGFSDSGSVSHSYEADFGGERLRYTRSGRQQWSFLIRVSLTADVEGVHLEVTLARGSQGIHFDMSDWEGDDRYSPTGARPPSYGVEDWGDPAPTYIDITASVSPVLIPWSRAWVPGKLRSKITGI